MGAAAEQSRLDEKKNVKEKIVVLFTWFCPPLWVVDVVNFGMKGSNTTSDPWE